MREQLFFIILFIGLLCFVISIPFGMIRTKVKKFSVLWFLLIHAPIPVSAVLRRYFDLSFWYIPVFLIFCVAGQIVGTTIMKRRSLRNSNI